jgi:alpha-methylacyl-CoA racemase
MSGPLAGITIVEMSGIGPAPFASMMLADHGARVISIDRPGADWSSADVLRRSRESIVLDLKQPAAIEVVRKLSQSADGFIEGCRPGVMERLGLGPDALQQENPKLVYGRMTGWGQTGPYAHAAGHDINYIALAGALHAFGRAGDKPTPPINIVGDFGGGGMMLAFGMVSALLHARETGAGQVIDCAMTDGAALLMSMTWGLFAEGRWKDERGVNLLDSGAHFYDTYETADGKFISLGSIEAKFYAELRDFLRMQDRAFDAQYDPRCWPELRDKLAAIVVSKTRDEWTDLLAGTDVCFAPVLSMLEAPLHAHNVERGTFIAVDGVTQPAPAPRYSGTPTDFPRAPERPGEATVRILRSLGYEDADLARLRAAGAII